MSGLSVRAGQGIKLLILRRFTTQGITFLGGIALARLLSPADFGTYGVLSTLVQFLALFGDIGISAYLIQRKEEISADDLQAGFTLQLAVTLTLIASLYVLAPILLRWFPDAPPTAVALLRLLAFSLLPGIFRSLSILQLERELMYNRIAPVEILESIVQQAVAVGCALGGAGTASFVYGLLARSVIGAGALYVMAPWPLRFRWVVSDFMRILRFGVPFQAAAALNMATAWTPALIAGPVLGMHAVGLLNWAYQNTRPPSALLESMTRVSFAHMARLQDDRSELERVIVRYLTLALLTSGAFVALMLTAGPGAILWIYSHRWAEGIPALLIYGFGLLAEAVTLIFTNAQTAQGLVQHSLRRAIVRVVVNFALSYLLIPVLGVSAIAVGVVSAMFVTIPLSASGLGRSLGLRTAGAVLWCLTPLLGSLFIGYAPQLLPIPERFQIPLSAVLTLVSFAAFTGFAGPEWLRRALIPRRFRSDAR